MIDIGRRSLPSSMASVSTTFVPMTMVSRSSVSTVPVAFPTSSPVVVLRAGSPDHHVLAGVSGTCGPMTCTAMLANGGIDLAAPGMTGTAAMRSGSGAPAARPHGPPSRWGRARPEVLRT